MKLALVAAVFLSIFSAVAFASTTVSGTPPGAVTVSTNCGFDVLGSTAGWVRLHLLNDSLSSAGRDIWVIPGEHYPLDVKDVEFFSATAGPSPFALSFDDSQQCGFTRSYAFDECPYESDVPANAGFYAGATGQVSVYWSAVNEDSEQQPKLHLGEFYPFGIRQCGFLDGSDLTYLTAVAN